MRDGWRVRLRRLKVCRKSTATHVFLDFFFLLFCVLGRMSLRTDWTSAHTKEIEQARGQRHKRGKGGGEEVCLLDLEKQRNTNVIFVKQTLMPSWHTPLASPFPSPLLSPWHLSMPPAPWSLHVFWAPLFTFGHDSIPWTIKSPCQDARGLCS